MLDLIKGRSVEEALKTVAFTKKAIAPMVEKVLRSALQNANYLSEERGSGRGRGQPLREDGDSQRRAAHEADSSGADGPRVSAISDGMSHIVITLAEEEESSAQTVGEEQVGASSAAA